MSERLARDCPFEQGGNKGFGDEKHDHVLLVPAVWTAPSTFPVLAGNAGIGKAKLSESKHYKIFRFVTGQKGRVITMQRPDSLNRMLRNQSGHGTGRRPRKRGCIVASRGLRRTKEPLMQEKIHQSSFHLLKLGPCGGATVHSEFYWCTTPQMLYFLTAASPQK